MALLDTLRSNDALFLKDIPQKPQGRYVHFVLLRETESFPLFQTDGSLNIIRVSAGRSAEYAKPMSRLVLFKRKQSSPERLTGRELLRSQDVITDDSCVYNSADFCKECPDCILYGYAIGSSGAEKSKVYVDSAFSVTPYETSHKAFSFNALYEHGTMTLRGETRTSFGEQDYIVPQVFFPSVVTLRDATYEGFLYVLGNLLRTDRYGAQETRTGKVHNHLLAVVWTNGEIFSNLRYTQVIYDALMQQNVDPENDLLTMEHLRQAALSSYADLMSEEPVIRSTEFVGDQAEQLRREVTSLYSDAAQTKEMISALAKSTREYARKYGAKK